jgi:hypothetical protein
VCLEQCYKLCSITAQNLRNHHKNKICGMLQVKAFGDYTRRCEEFYVSRDDEGDVIGLARTKFVRALAPEMDKVFLYTCIAK